MNFAGTQFRLQHAVNTPVVVIHNAFFSPVPMGQFYSWNFQIFFILIVFPGLFMSRKCPKSRRLDSCVHHRVVRCLEQRWAHRRHSEVLRISEQSLFLSSFFLPIPAFPWNILFVSGLLWDRIYILLGTQSLPPFSEFLDCVSAIGFVCQSVL